MWKFNNTSTAGIFTRCIWQWMEDQNGWRIISPFVVSWMAIINVGRDNINRLFVSFPERDAYCQYCKGISKRRACAWIRSKRTRVWHNWIRSAFHEMCTTCVLCCALLWIGIIVSFQITRTGTRTVVNIQQKSFACLMGYHAVLGFVGETVHLHRVVNLSLEWATLLGSVEIIYSLNPLAYGLWKCQQLNLHLDRSLCCKQSGRSPKVVALFLLQTLVAI